jgi:hypothetical protein
MRKEGRNDKWETKKEQKRRWNYERMNEKNQKKRKESWNEGNILNYHKVNELVSWSIYGLFSNQNYKLHRNSWVHLPSASELLPFTSWRQQAQGSRRESDSRLPLLRVLEYSLPSLVTYCGENSRNLSFRLPACSLKFFRRLKKRFEWRGGAKGSMQLWRGAPAKLLFLWRFGIVFFPRVVINF